MRRTLAAGALALAIVLPPAARAASGETWVPYPQVLAEVRSGPLIRAIINPGRHDVEIKFRNLDEWHAYYPPAAQAQLQRLLASRHVRTLFVPLPPASAGASSGGGSHPLRWVAAAVAALALAGALVLRRRRARSSA